MDGISLAHDLGTRIQLWHELASVYELIGDFEAALGAFERMLRLSWVESGGPPVKPPARKGFGSRFLERALATQVGGEMALAYPETGVTFTLTAPLAAFSADGSGRGT